MLVDLAQIIQRQVDRDRAESLVEPMTLGRPRAAPHHVERLGWWPSNDSYVGESVRAQP
jgi:hypothetical protein